MEMPSTTLQLAMDLIRRESVTPEDDGCQKMLADRLSALGFNCEHLRFEDVDNLWASHGESGPLFCFAGHTDVVPPGAPNIGNSRLLSRKLLMACSAAAVPQT